MRLLIDAAALPLRRATALFPADGEYARTIVALAGGGRVLALVPDRVVLSIYTSELCERLREQARLPPDGTEPDPERLVHAPFWPELLFEAAGELAHPAREVERLWPKLLSVVYVERDVATLRAASQRILGGERFDVARYVAAGVEFARAGHFQRIEP